MQRAALGHSRDRSAAGPDFENVDHRNLDRQRLFIAADQSRAGGQHVMIKDHAGFGRGAAHVEGDGIGDSELPANGLRRDDARCRSRFEHAHAFLSRLAHFEQAAGRLHDQERAAKACARQMLSDLGQIARDVRADIGIGRDRRGTFELTIFLRQLVGCGDENARQKPLKDRLGAPFMRWVAVTMKEQNRHRFDRLTFQHSGKLGDLLVPQRLQDFASGQHPLVHFVAVLARHQRPVLGKEQIVGIGPVHAPDLIDVAKAFGDQQRRLRARPLQDGVDGDGRAVQEQARIGKIRARFRHACFDALNEDVWRGQRLAQQQAPARLVEGSDVGEGAADIGCHPQSLGLCHGFAAALIQSARAFSACWASFTTSGGVA